VVGGGTQIALWGGFSVGAEYLYAKFGAWDFSGVQSSRNTDGSVPF